jgi:hypothetical protein
VRGEGGARVRRVEEQEPGQEREKEDEAGEALGGGARGGNGRERMSGWRTRTGG